VTLAGDLGVDDVDRLCMDLEPFTSLSSHQAVSLDLSALGSVSASCLAVLVAVLRTAYSKSLRDPLCAFVAPVDPSLHGWLSEGSLRRLLEHGRNRPSTMEQTCGGCEPFSSVDGIVQARERLLAFVTEQADLDERARSTVRQLLWDLAQNVLVHADIGGGVATARVDAKRQTLEIAVADRGIGIRESFVRAAVPDIGDDASAMRAALEPGFTSAPEEEGKGMGLYLAKRALANNGGTLALRSGNARVEEPSDGQAADPLASFKGTLVTALARLDRPLDVELVFEMFESEADARAVPRLDAARR